MATASFGRNEMQIVGDGKRMAILMNDGSMQSAYEMTDPIMTNFTIRMNHSLNTFRTLGGKDNFFIDQAPEPVEIEMRIMVVPDKFKVFSTNKGNIMFDLDMFRNLTVKDLFKEINKKVEARGKEDK